MIIFICFIGEKIMKKFLLSLFSAVLPTLSATAQIDQSLYAKPLVDQAINQPAVKDLYADAFDFGDVNNDKFISENEFSHIVEAVDAEVNLTDQEKNDKKARLLKSFVEVDSNKDNKLDAAEFHNFMIAETQIEAQKRLNKMSEIFNSANSETEMQKQMDQALEQLHKATAELQKISTQDMAASFIDGISNSIADENYFQMDKNKDGCATREEFVNYTLGYQKNQHEKSPDIFESKDLMSAEEIADWYDSIDKKKDNCLTKEEYIKDFTDLSISDINQE